MGILERFEQRVDRLVNGAFARAFAAEVQPIEIAAALTNEATDRAVIMGAGRTVVPNFFQVELSPADYDRLTAFAEQLRTELAAVLREHVSEQRYTTLGQVKVDFALDESLATGLFRVSAEVRDELTPAETAATTSTRRGPHLVIDGYSHPLTRQRTVLGRGSDADIRIEDNGVSRHHCEILLSVPPKLVDLGSTNGTWVHGQRVTEIALNEDLDIALGNVVVQFRSR